MSSRLIPAAVLFMALLLLGSLLAVLAIDPQQDYAALVPAPDSVLLEEGDETVFWLSTSETAVEMRIAAVGLGVGSFHRLAPTTGASQTLGRGEGCLPADAAAVSVVLPPDIGVGLVACAEADDVLVSLHDGGGGGAQAVSGGHSAGCRPAGAAGTPVGGEPR